MLAYAPRPERRRISPTALALIVGAHAVAIVAVMSAKLDVSRHDPGKTIITFIPKPPPPTPPQDPKPQHPIAKTTFTAPKPPVDLSALPRPPADSIPPLPPVTGSGTSIDPIPPLPKPTPIVHSGPRFATPPGDIRPPYPEALRAQEKEAVLRLRLGIDERGRVVSVDPVGKADPAFLAAARRHILKAWRYAPAMEGDRAIASSTVITLEFKLDS